MNDMTYKDYHLLSNTFTNTLYSYVIKTDNVNNSYYLARVLLNEMSEKAFKDKLYLQIVCKWFNGGGTLDLMKALFFTTYDSNNLIHFNAMSLLDSVSLIKIS